MPKTSTSSSEASTASRSRELRPYQAEGIKWLRSGEQRKLLADEPGLGKSRQLIESSEGRTLVVAPAMVLDGGTWKDELELWADDPERFTTVSYSMLNEREKTDKGGTRPIDALREPYTGHWDTVILDEAHYVKGRKTSWTNATRKLQTDRLFLATGTPFPNWAHEMFVPLQLIFPDEAKMGKRFGSYWRWAGEWFDTTPTRWSRGLPSVGEMLACSPSCFDRPAYDPCVHYLRFAEENLGNRFLQRLRDDVLTDLPPLTEVVVDTPMVPKQERMWKQLKKDFVAWAEDGREISAWTDSALHVKLDRLSTGMEVVGAGAGSGKFDRMLFDLENRARPTLVVAHYKDTLNAAAKLVQERLKLRVRVVHGDKSRGERRNDIADFKAGRVDVLFGSLDTIAEGLTLTVADMIIGLEKSYKPSRNVQAMRRIHRLGQERPVTVLWYKTPRVDDGKWRLIDTKTDRQIRTMRAAELIAAWE